MKGILTDPGTGDLQVKGGTLAVGDTSEQIAEAVITASCGEFKEYPLIGAGITNLINGTASAIWCSETKDMLNACGLSVTRVKIGDNMITIE